MKYLWWIFLWIMSGLITWVVLMAIVRMFQKGARRDWMPEIPELEVIGEKSDCGYECHYTKEYGFVPEAGCPFHDPDDPPSKELH